MGFDSGRRRSGTVDNSGSKTSTDSGTAQISTSVDTGQAQISVSVSETTDHHYPLAYVLLCQKVDTSVDKSADARRTVEEPSAMDMMMARFDAMEAQHKSDIVQLQKQQQQLKKQLTEKEERSIKEQQQKTGAEDWSSYIDELEQKTAQFSQP